MAPKIIMYIKMLSKSTSLGFSTTSMVPLKATLL
jgi:hypothetical protein